MLFDERLVCMSVTLQCKYYLWVRGVSRGRVRQRLIWGRRCHAPALGTLLFLSLRPADSVVGRGRSAAAGLRLALGGGLLQLLERFLYNRGSARQFRRAVGGCPVGNSGLWLRVHTVSGNRQTQTSIHGLDFTQLRRLKFLKGRFRLNLELNINIRWEAGCNLILYLCDLRGWQRPIQVGPLYLFRWHTVLPRMQHPLLGGMAFCILPGFRDSLIHKERLNVIYIIQYIRRKDQKTTFTSGRKAHKPAGSRPLWCCSNAPLNHSFGTIVHCLPDRKQGRDNILMQQKPTGTLLKL